MNAYSSGIRNISRVILLYPRITQTDQMVGEYAFMDTDGINRPLEIRTVDLLECLSWNQFLRNFKLDFSPTII